MIGCRNAVLLKEPVNWFNKDTETTTYATKNLAIQKSTTTSPAFGMVVRVHDVLGSLPFIEEVLVAQRAVHSVHAYHIGRHDDR